MISISIPISDGSGALCIGDKQLHHGGVDFRQGLCIRGANVTCMQAYLGFQRGGGGASGQAQYEKCGVRWGGGGGGGGCGAVRLRSDTKSGPALCFANTLSLIIN